MWKCKECGGTDFAAYLKTSVSEGMILRHKNFVIAKENIMGFECMDCRSYTGDLETLAEWVEEDGQDS